MSPQSTGLRSFDRALLRHGEVQTIASTAGSGHAALPSGFGAALIREGPTEFDVPPMPDHVVFLLLSSRKLVGGRLASSRAFEKDFRPGYLNILPAGSDSWWRSQFGGPNLHLHFAPEQLSRWFAHEPTGYDLRPVLNADDPTMRRLARTMAFELESGQPGGQMMIEGLALQIGAHLLRSYGTGSAPLLAKGGLAPWQLRRVIEMMMAHLSEPLGLDALAEAVRLSRFHFVRAFKATTGLPPHRYLMQLRIERAQMLLETTALPIADVAARVGYGAPQAFAELFRRETGWTPTAYRAVRQG